MKLAAFDTQPVVPWTDGGEIPWHEPAFSERMLREHLSQDHDLASRRFETIDRHVSWLHHQVLRATAGRVLDLGCGPGLYTARLAKLGHRCVGIDISPASISYARTEAERQALACDYRLEDLRAADFGSGFDLVLFAFGAFNAFPPAAAAALLAKARGAVRPSGALVLEAQTEAHVRSIGSETPTWFRAPHSVFSDEPHLLLRECAWHAEQRTTTERYFALSLQSAEVVSFVSSTQAYSDAEYEQLLHDAGFAAVARHASLAGEPGADDEGILVLVAGSG